MNKKIGTAFWLITVVAAFIVLLNLGAIPLLDPDEPVYAQTPKEMLQTNDFVSPRIYGDYWYDKPPLYYWLVVLSFKLFGISEFAARFPSALLSVLCALTVYYSGKQLFNERVGILGSLILITSIEYIYLGKAAVTDMTLTFFLTTCLLSFLQKRYYLFYICAGLATLTKGPIGLLFPGGIVFFYFLFTQNFAEIKKMNLVTGILLTILFGLPWYFVMYNIHGYAFTETFLGFHNITRFTSPEHPELGVWYYYIPVLMIGFFPWTSLLIQSVWNSLRNSREKAKILLFLNIWAIFIFLFFTASRTKLVSYILPLYPPLAIIVGWYIDRLWANSLKQKRHIVWALFTLVITSLFVIMMLWGGQAAPILQTNIVIMSATLELLMLLVVYFLWNKQIGLAFGTKIATMTIVSVLLFTMIFPILAPNFTSYHIAQTFKTHYDGKSDVYIAKFLRPGFSFYTDVYGSEITADNLSATVNHAGRAYFILSQTEYKRLSQSDRNKLRILSNSADKLLLLRE